MISFLEGTIEYAGDKFVIINTGSIGYKVTVVPRLLNILSNRKSSVKDIHEENQPKIRLFIHSQMNMREGTFDMYGFDKREDLELFHLLTSVSGIGPKGAMNILSAVEPAYLKAAVVNEDPDSLRKVSGLGSKTAHRLVIELKNKVDHIDGGKESMDLGQESNALEALMALGYSQYQAKDALKEAKGKTLEDRVREALRLLGKK